MLYAWIIYDANIHTKMFQKFCQISKVLLDYLGPKLIQFWYFWHFFTNFQKHFLLPKWPYQWSGALLQCSRRRISMRSFSNCQKKQWFSWFLKILIILWFWAQGPLGPWDPPFFEILCKIVLWSGIYLEVFLGCLGVQGTP